MKPILVIKVGGSLFDWSALAQRLNDYLKSLDGFDPILIAGGGDAADVVREFDRTHTLGESAAHALALYSLDLTSHLLRAIVPRSQVVTDITSINMCRLQNQVPILAPQPFLEHDTTLPQNWSVTTDSIAAHFASELSATKLVLLKSVSVEAGMTREAAVARGVVDGYFPTASRALSVVELINMRESPLHPIRLL